MDNRIKEPQTKRNIVEFFFWVGWGVTWENRGGGGNLELRSSVGLESRGGTSGY